jgi:FkbM family methyltransferase
MKEVLVGTGFGRLALTARNAMELLRAAYGNVESLGTVANDHIATLLVTRLCLPKKGFVDVGAHIGSIVSDVIRHNPSIKLYAIEPIAAKADNLRRKFPSIELHNCALGESDGETPFFVNTKQSGYSSLLKPVNTEATIVVTVSVRRLDTLISSNDIDVVKIDVEGAELGVLRGGDILIARSCPLIMFESAPHTDGTLGYTHESLWQWLHERDFDIVIPNRVAHNGPGLSLDGFIEAHLYPRRTTNYFAIPKGRRIEIRDRARRVLKLSLDC